MIANIPTIAPIVVSFCSSHSVVADAAVSTRSVPFSPPSTWASTVAAIDSVSSARTMNGVDLVGDSSNHADQPQSTKSLGEFLKLPITPPTAAARSAAKRPRALVAGK